jgi:hypothetical protein
MRVRPVKRTGHTERTYARLLTALETTLDTITQRAFQKATETRVELLARKAEDLAALARAVLEETA